MYLLNWVWIGAAGIIAGIGAIIAFYWITQRVILRPIRHLRALVNNVADGNLDIRSSIKSGDEYEKLASAFNKMLDGLHGIMRVGFADIAPEQFQRRVFGGGIRAFSGQVLP